MILAQFAATDTHAVRVVSYSDPQYAGKVAAQILDRTGSVVRTFNAQGSETMARAKANIAWTNLRNGHGALETSIFAARCVQCGKPATSGRPLLAGRQGITHDSCDNYR